MHAERPKRDWEHLHTLAATLCSEEASTWNTCTHNRAPVMIGHVIYQRCRQCSKT
jgi:hypothetical protein